MKTIKGIFIILLFLALGNICSWCIGNFIPGSVCGMVLLFIALLCRIIKEDDIRTTADFLTRNMTIFFIPASIGIMEQWGLISANIAGWLCVVFLSTVCVLAVTGLAEECFIRMSGRKRKEAEK
ncbi:MAG: CidA/LrgA family protein [Bacteroidales bacterium]|nr:CidA/LrgA family protein [Bacteroidales bacterium]MDE7126768.1 CidA/LrgA family protein [Bacteroidales bacterium]